MAMLANGALNSYREMMRAVTEIATLVDAA